jgi:GcrA cell cycle regulator
MEWTAEQTTILCREWAKNQTASEIAKLVGKSRNAVIGKAHRLCLTPKDVISGKVSPLLLPAIEERKRKKKVTESLPPKPIAESKPINRKKPIGMLELNVDTCRAPVGYDRKGMVTYCGCKTQFGKSFCPTHCRIFYIKRVA